VVENRPSPSLWPMAYTTACTTVQAVILSPHPRASLRGATLVSFKVAVLVKLRSLLSTCCTTIFMYIRLLVSRHSRWCDCVWADTRNDTDEAR